jgi:hypothetical protein
MKATEMKKGMPVWISCDVRGGPFPNERRVLIKTGISEWFGFVSTSELKDKVPEGKDHVRAVVVDVKSEYVVVGIRGQSPASGEIQARPAELTENVAVEA